MKKNITIDIAVGGRFHADQMAKGFLEAGFPLHLITSYPKSRFPHLPLQNIKSVLSPEIAYRVLRRIGLERLGEQVKMRFFGKKVSERVGSDNAFSFIWSSFALEKFESDLVSHKVLVRDSTHIVHQCQVLAEEFGHLDIPYQPDEICVNRELKEYELADSIIVLSEFAKKTFIERGISPHKLVKISLGVNTALFKPAPEKKYKLPLKALYFGTLSVRKGIHYLLEATKDIPKSQLQLFLVGPVEPSFKPILRRYSHAKVLGPMPHSLLAPFAAKQDLYLFPSLEDGFPNTLIQAMGAGLVPITTPDCGPADFINHGVNGFLFKKRECEALREVIFEVIRHPEKLYDVRQNAILLSQEFTWERYHQSLVSWVKAKSEGKEVHTENKLTPEGKGEAFRGATLVAER